MSHRRETRKSKVINRERFTGGHFAPVSPGRALSFLWVIVMKVCTECKLEKNESEFHKRSASKDGLQHRCKSCVSNMTEMQKEARAEYKIKYNRENREKIAQTKKKYYQSNREKILSRQKEYQEENKHKKMERDRQYEKRRRKADPVFAMTRRAKSRMQQALERGGFTKSRKTLEALGCSAYEFAIHIERQFLKGMTWENRDQWHLDHIIPISSAKTEEEVYALSHFTNIRPMWAKDNKEKYDKITTLI